MSVVLLQARRVAWVWSDADRNRKCRMRAEGDLNVVSIWHRPRFSLGRFYTYSCPCPFLNPQFHWRILFIWHNLAQAALNFDFRAGSQSHQGCDTSNNKIWCNSVSLQNKWQMKGMWMSWRKDPKSGHRRGGEIYFSWLYCLCSFVYIPITLGYLISFLCNSSWLHQSMHSGTWFVALWRT